MNYFLKPRFIIPVILAVPAAIISYFFDAVILDFFAFFHNPLFDKMANWMAESEFVIFVLIIMAGLLMIEMKKTKWLMPLFSTLIISFSTSYLFKLIFSRRRPYGIEGALGVADYSLPSSHATVAFAVAALLTQEFPRVAWFFYLFAIGTSLSRVYLEKHYLSDVIAGAILGYIIGNIILYIVNRYIFKRKIS